MHLAHEDGFKGLRPFYHHRVEPLENPPAVNSDTLHPLRGTHFVTHVKGFQILRVCTIAFLCV